MKQGVLTRIAEALRRKRYRSSSAGGIDNGRDSFARVIRKEQRIKQNLLKKLNAFWTQKKLAAQVSYSSSKRSSGRFRTVFLVVCLTVVSGVFLTTKGPGGLLGVLESIDYFRLTAVDVRGCLNASAQQVRVASGVTVNNSLFSLDVEKISEAVKAADPWIKDAKVSRSWPDKLVIHVSEYEAYALITVATKDRADLYYLDSDGTPFLMPDIGMDLDYPVVTGLERMADGDERITYLQEPLLFLRLVRANNPNLPAQSVSEVHVDEREGVVVYLVEHPFPIFLGNGEIRQKYVRLRRVLEVLYKPRKTGMDIARVAYIRMNYLQDKVIVGYRES